MLTIRREQMMTFQAIFLEKFVRETAAELVTTHAEELAARRSPDPRQLAVEIVHAAIAAASRLGADSEAAVRSVAGLLLREGDDFATRASPAWVRTIAGDPSLGGDDKIALLEALYRQDGRRPAIDDDSDPEAVGGVD